MALQRGGNSRRTGQRKCFFSRAIFSRNNFDFARTSVLVIFESFFVKIHIFHAVFIN